MKWLISINITALVLGLGNPEVVRGLGVRPWGDLASVSQFWVCELSNSGAGFWKPTVPQK